MSSTPPTRLTDDIRLPQPRSPQPADRLPPAPVSPTERSVTAAQVDRAVLQLRERRGQTPVEQVKAVLRALDLIVAPVNPEVPA